MPSPETADDPLVERGHPGLASASQGGGNLRVGGRVDAGVIEKTSISFGPESQNRLREAGDPSGTGAEAALETFYYALNNRDLDVLRADWANSPLAQLNNPSAVFCGALMPSSACTARSSAARCLSR